MRRAKPDSAMRRVHIDSVLAEQEKQRRQGAEFCIIGTEAIRDVAHKTSLPSCQLALKLAAYDEVEAV